MVVNSLVILRSGEDLIPPIKAGVQSFATHDDERRDPNTQKINSAENIHGQL